MTTLPVHTLILGLHTTRPLFGTLLVVPLTTLLPGVPLPQRFLLVVSVAFSVMGIMPGPTQSL